MDKANTWGEKGSQENEETQEENTDLTSSASPQEKPTATLKHKSSMGFCSQSDSFTKG